jgi:hypothetical protein
MRNLNSQMTVDKNEMLSRVYSLAKTISRSDHIPPDAGICHGLTGISFFFLELYRTTADPAFLEEIEKQLASLEQYHRSNPTNNYTLFAGRSGIIYLYLEVYRATNNTRYLERSADLLREYLSKKCYSFVFINNDGLFDGLAGILLLLLQLFLELKDPALIQPMETIVLSLIHHLYIGTNTIHVGTLTGKHQPKFGIAKGPAGIAFVFCELGRLSSNPVFDEIATGLLNYEDAFWLPTLSGSRSELQHLSLTDGICGAALTRLYVSRQIKNAEYLHQWDLTSQYLRARRDQILQLPQQGLCHGLSGIGMTWLEAFRLTGDQSCLDEAASIGASLSESLERSEATGDIGIDGLCGAGYYLLKLCAVSDTRSGFLFLPRSGNDGDAVQQLKNSLLSRHHPGIPEHLVRKHFPATCQGLREFYPEWMNEKISTSELIWPAVFIKQVSALLKSQPVNPATREIIGNFDKERYAAKLHLELMTLPFLGKDDFAGHLDNILALEDESFLNLRLILSPNIWIYSPAQQSQPGQAPQFDLEMTSFLCQATPFDTLYHRYIGLERLILDRFATPKTVRQAVHELLFFLSARKEAIKDYLVNYYRFTPEKNFQLFLHNLLLEAVRSSLNGDLLQVFENPHPMFDTRDKIFSRM